MKVTLNLDQLFEEGRIDAAEYERLTHLAARSTDSLAFNVLLGFGVIAVSGATLALLTTHLTAILLGLVVGGAGVILVRRDSESWKLLAGICVLVGALLLGGGLVSAAEGSSAALVLVAAIFCAAGIHVRSALLTVLAVLALSSALGADTGYTHARYYLGIEAPTATIILFSILAAVLALVSERLPSRYHGILNAAAVTSLFLVNLGFWIGSLWGDEPWRGTLAISDGVFALAWALALLGGALAAWMASHRWLFNLIAVFGAIHFYTQWFERLGATPETLLWGGLLALAFAIGLHWLNKPLE